MADSAQPRSLHDLISDLQQSVSMYTDLYKYRYMYTERERVFSLYIHNENIIYCMLKAGLELIVIEASYTRPLSSLLGGSWDLVSKVISRL